MKSEKIPFSWVISKMAYDSSNFIKGSIFTFTTLYLIGSTFILYKIIERKDNDQNDWNLWDYVSTIS